MMMNDEDDAIVASGKTAGRRFVFVDYHSSVLLGALMEAQHGTQAHDQGPRKGARACGIVTLLQPARLGGEKRSDAIFFPLQF